MFEASGQMQSESHNAAEDTKRSVPAVPREKILNENIQDHQIKASGEDYLLAIYAICRAKGSVRQIDIAEDMGFSNPSVTRAMKKLSQKGLLLAVGNQSGKDVYLTEAGRALAERMYRRRLIVTAFLESLGLSKRDAAKEADLWEHGVGEETTDAMEAALARPESRHAPAS
jgi:Mn-dependent DtxR family transcriptional regulator